MTGTDSAFVEWRPSHLKENENDCHFGAAPATRASTAKTRAVRTPNAGLAGYKRQAVNVGMLASLLVCLLGAALGAETLHIIAGFVFVAIFGIHL